jgi:hypothetical protein
MRPLGCRLSFRPVYQVNEVNQQPGRQENPNIAKITNGSAGQAAKNKQAKIWKGDFTQLLLPFIPLT